MNPHHGPAVRPSSRLSNSRFFILMVIAAGLGCARGGQPASPDPLAITLTLNKTAYRPGEAVLATVEAVNNTHSPLTLHKLNSKNLVFIFGRRDDSERLERRAVASDQENLDETMSLEPGRSEKRVFLLTRLTEFSGPMVLQVHFTPGPLARNLDPKFYSDTPAYAVEGTRLFQRDPEGFILKEEAIKVARAAAGAPAGEVQAIFVRDEAGFFKWWVNLKSAGASGPTAWLVDPYLGTPWHQAQPFDPKLGRDPRFERPADLPKLRIPARGK